MKDEKRNLIIERFSFWYSPAETIDQATDFFSTAEIAEAMNQLDPSNKVKPQQVFDLMTSSGFHFAPDPHQLSFNLKWMLIRKF